MMHNGIVIKSSRAGMTVLLDPSLPFEELLEAVAKKFKDSAKFWGAVQMTLTLEGRPRPRSWQWSTPSRKIPRLISSVS